LKDKIIVSIKPDGSFDCLATKSEQLAAELAKYGITLESTLRRASHVEPDSLVLRVLFHGLRRLAGEQGAVAAFTRGWPVLWRADMGPSGGPVLPGRWRDRREAIAAEIEWLNERIGKSI
jgi:hypothetical protein